ncbi:SIMPL domain-containing protein [Paenibacillus sp. GSMTC-2017]|uniref:SIMPL domain-containing protein n=1 Tax=Paenibacillus sp. GSMTC-2017 TaxID=2794350 RepID=UPI0018D9EBD3|nr:SIMPL domain-containing protein [Paenibacillus sp. GSMTC-2017]MBH5319926.1 SIMPL domain-containing protein [Paenibacillus sp. GSMTC-2017]
MLHSAAKNQGTNSESTCDMKIEVVGEGVVSVAPDRTLITLGAVKEGKDVKAIQSENSAIITGVIEALTGLGIPREQIQTVTYDIEPQYDYDSGRQVFRGYKVTHLLQIHLNGVEGAGAVIDAAVESGANSITNISFASSHSAIAEQQALTAAVRHAGEKATTIADALGVALSAIPCDVKELSQGAEPVHFKAAMAMDSASTPIAPGQLTFKASVRVWYLFA